MGSLKQPLLGLAASAAVACLCSLTICPASWAFGSTNAFGQKAEHERLTRAALGCGSEGVDEGCLEPASISELAGSLRTFGLVGGPDVMPPEKYTAHCDDADFLDIPGYPHDRTTATAILFECITKLRDNFDAAVTLAQHALERSNRRIRRTEVLLSNHHCLRRGHDDRAKCRSLQMFGAALHGVQDFYSHSNWGDIADPGRGIGLTNPPGLGHHRPADFLNLRLRTDELKVERNLTTGCFKPVADFFPGNPDTRIFGCYHRIKHRNLNKDNGLIDPLTGETRQPKTRRGQLFDNFQNAVDLAIADTRRQWSEFKNEIRDRYGPDRGEAMICVLAHDHPEIDCQA